MCSLPSGGGCPLADVQILAAAGSYARMLRIADREVDGVATCDGERRLNGWYLCQVLEGVFCLNSVTSECTESPGT